MNLNIKSKMPEYISKRLDKYKYVALICLVGLVLIVWPTAKKEQVRDVAADIEDFNTAAMVKSMEETLGSIEGVGRIKIILTLKSGYETVYAFNRDANILKGQDSMQTESKSQMVIISSQSGQTPVTVKTKYPSFLGAVVVCDGADSATVQWQLTEAVKSLTGITSDNIVISKMKQ